VLRYFKEGFVSAWKQPFAVVALFVYQLVWGTLLYKAVHSIVVPLMHRFPDAEQGVMARHLFLAESQFQLFKTDLPITYLWWAFGLLAARMALHPIINAGVYYSLANRHLNAGYRFVSGIKNLTAPFFVYYICQMALTALPIVWLWPVVKQIFRTTATYQAILIELLPWFAGYLAYGYLLHLVFMHIQFSRTHRIGTLSSMLRMIRYSPIMIGLAALLLIVTGICTAAAIVASQVWAGFLALLLFQLFPIIGMYFRVWSIASQYELWSAKTGATI